MKILIKKFTLFILIVVLFISCSKQLNNSGELNQNDNQQSQVNDIPYATIEELDAVRSLGNDYLDWKIVKSFAEIELGNFQVTQGWIGAKLSERPIIIYDSKSSPLYYEFRVIRNNEMLGALTTTAQKKLGLPVQFALDQAPDYKTVKRKGSNYKVIAHGYPRVASGDEVQNIVDVNGDSVALQENDPVKIAEQNPEILEKSGKTLEEIKQEQVQKESENKEMWDGIEKETNPISEMTADEMEVMSEYMSYLRESADTARSFDYDGGKLISPKNPNFNYNENYKKVKEKLNWTTDTWCGPAAVAYGLYVLGETNKIIGDNGYLGLKNALGTWDSGPTMPWMFDYGISWATDNRYNETWHYGTDWWRVKEAVGKDMPFIVGSFTHYQTGVGYKQHQYEFLQWIEVPTYVTHRVVESVVQRIKIKWLRWCAKWITRVTYFVHYVTQQVIVKTLRTVIGHHRYYRVHDLNGVGNKGEGYWFNIDSFSNFGSPAYTIIFRKSSGW